MIKNAFIESLKIVDGRFIHPDLHWQRITATRKIDFETYSPRRVHTLKLVDGSGIDYTFKYADRDKLIQLQQSKGTCDEILIYQNGRITDTSYSNVVFYDGNQYITPSTYLLNGTKRRYLLERGIIKEQDIGLGDLPRFRYLFLINAMLDLEDNIQVKIRDIS